MAYIHVDADDFSTSELIFELGNRYLDDGEKSQLLDLAKQDEDNLKLKFIFKVYDKYSLKELEELFKEDYSTLISPNQLTLPLP